MVAVIGRTRRVSRLASLLVVAATGCGETGLDSAGETRTADRRHNGVATADGAFVTGVVVDESGGPVSGAEVHVRWVDSGEEMWHAAGPNTSQFTLGPFRAGEPLSMQARLPEVGFSEVKEVAATASDVTMVVRRGGVLRGRVLDEEGTPLRLSMRLQRTTLAGTGVSCEVRTRAGGMHWHPSTPTRSSFRSAPNTTRAGC